MGIMRVLCNQGDIVVAWDPDSEADIAKAQGEFDSLKTAGYEFFNKASGRGKKRLTKFNAKAGEIFAVPGVMKKADKQTQSRPKAMAGQPNDSLVLTRR